MQEQDRESEGVGLQFGRPGVVDNGENQGLLCPAPAGYPPSVPGL